MIEINSEKLYEDYVGKLDKEILPSIDYDLLQASYKTEDKLYAKEVLKKLHEGFVEVYQTYNLESYEYDFVLVPAVIKCQNTGEICIGLN